MLYLAIILEVFITFSLLFQFKNMPDAVYLFTLIKFGLMGLTCFISIKIYSKNLSLLYFNTVNILCFNEFYS